MGRKAGFTLSETERQKVSERMREQSEQRGSWSAIQRAIQTGDRELAHELIDRRIDIQAQEAS